MKFIPFFLDAGDESWFKIFNDIFALDMGEYENLGFGEVSIKNS